MTLEAKKKSQAILIEGLNMEKKDLKKLLQILEEREHSFKEDIFDLKNQLEKAKKIEDEIVGNSRIELVIVRNLNLS